MLYDFTIDLKKFLKECHILHLYSIYKITKAGISINLNVNKPRIVVNTCVMKSLSLEMGISVEKLISMTISHEVMHTLLTEQIDFKSSKKWDNISEGLMNYGVW